MEKIPASELRRRIAREFLPSKAEHVKTGFATPKLLIKDVLEYFHILPYMRQLQFYRRLHKNDALFKKRFDIEIEGVSISFVTEEPHARSWFHWRYRAGDLHEPPVSVEFARRVINAKVIADIGGHMGYYSCIAAAVNRNVQVFCFEMNQNLLPLIEANLAENHLDNVTVVHAAVAGQRQSVSYDVDSLAGSLAMDIPTSIHEKTDRRAYVETVTLDDFFKAQDLVPDIIKIDVQGAEMGVLRGGHEVIGMHHPTIFLELHPTHIVNFGSTADEVLDYLKSHNYSLYKFPDHRREGKPERLADKPELSNRDDMILCL